MFLANTNTSLQGQHRIEPLTCITSYGYTNVSKIVLCRPSSDTTYYFTS